MENKFNLRPILSFLFFLLLFAACAPQAEEQAEVPQDLAGKKQLLREKEAQLSELSEEIERLKKDVRALDPSIQDEAKLVTTSILEPVTFSKFVEIQGAVKSSDEVSASSESGGRIISLLIDEGSYVKKGQLIARLDLEILDKQKQELEKAYELAKTVYEKRASLWEKNIGSEIEYLEAKNNKERLEKNLETINFQMSKANVYAPISGQVDRVNIEAGEMASPGAPIALIISTAQVKVVADVPENYLPSVRKGSYVDINIPALDMQTRAKVSQVGRTINPLNRTFEVEVRLRNKGGTLKPNLLATMLIKEYSQDNSLVMGLDWIQQEVSGQNYVYVVQEKEDKFFPKKIYIEMGESYDGKVIVSEGLKAGDQIIEEGSRGLSEKNEIQIAPNSEG